MAEHDRETHYVEKSNGGGAAWFIAGALIVAVLIGGLLYANGFFGTGDSVSIEMNAPSTDTGTGTTPNTAPDTDTGAGSVAPAPEAPAPEAPAPAAPADGQ